MVQCAMTTFSSVKYNLTVSFLIFMGVIYVLTSFTLVHSVVYIVLLLFIHRVIQSFFTSCVCVIETCMKWGRTWSIKHFCGVSSSSGRLKGRMDSTGLSEYAKHCLREICSQEWVREKFLKEPEHLFTVDLLLDKMLSNRQVSDETR